LQKKLPVPNVQELLQIKGNQGENNMNLWEYTGPLGQKKPSNAGFTFGIAPRRETLQWIESILSPGWA